MITAVELNDLVAASKSACQPDGRHGRFCAAADHSHFLDGGNPFADELRHFHLQRIRNSKTETALRGFAYCIDNHFRGMTQNRRAPTAYVIDVFILIDIPNLCALSYSKEIRLN